MDKVLLVGRWIFGVLLHAQACMHSVRAHPHPHRSARGREPEISSTDSIFDFNLQLFDVAEQ
jgi:hypothetical protein